MAKLDQIVHKWSSAPESDFRLSLTGENPGDASNYNNKIEKGEIVLRLGSGYAELWTLDINSEATQVSVDLAGVVPPFDPNDLGDAKLGDIGDVSYTDGLNGSLGLGQAGQVLTWDGLKWVIRPVPGIEDGIIESLDDAGDVNYGLFATPSNPKYAPDNLDILQWNYNSFTQSYQWAPIAFKIENLANIDLYGNTKINFSLVNYTGFRWGSLNATTPPPTLSVTSSSLLLEYNNTKIGLDNGAIVMAPHYNSAIELRVGGSSAPANTRAKGIKYTESTIPLEVPDDTYLPALRHVRNDWVNMKLGDIGNVDDANILNGQVLTWNALQNKYLPTSGIAPDLSVASINEFQDVYTTGATRGLSLVWDPDSLQWKPQSPKLNYATWDYFSFFYTSTDPNNYTTRCKECNAANLGRITVVENVPYICLAVRSSATTTNNTVYDYVELLSDGYNRTKNKSLFPSNQTRQAIDSPYSPRTDALQEVAYTGNLGSLANVSTTNAFDSATIVYDASQQAFVIGYPAVNLADYALGMIGDVDLAGAGVGYGILFDGTNWVASSLEQKIRLDDLQDVQFGTIGFSNTKLVAAYMLVQGDVVTYTEGEDLSAALAVSTQKATADMGTTFEVLSPDGHFYPTARYFTPGSNWSLAEKLANYVSWNHDGSWQTLDGDFTVELFFYPTQLLDSRTLIRKVASSSSLGGWILRLTQSGAIQLAVTATSGGFTITSTNNYVSINNWHHVAITKFGNTNRLYLDGNLVGSAISSAPFTGDQKFVLGRNDLFDDNTLTHHFFKGAMQDLRVYKGRAKYTESTYTVPTSLQIELLDSTPQAGDFLSYDGTKWTNVNGIDADISGKSITELADVDTTSYNPETGDALVWTGSKWEPGIPGLGATWSLDDMTDVSTYYGYSIPYLRFDQAELMTFSTAFMTPGDESYLRMIRGTIGNSIGTQILYYDNTFTCNPSIAGRDGTYADQQETFINCEKLGNISIRGTRVTVLNEFTDCTIASFTYHEDALHYSHVPDRGSTNPNGDIPGTPQATYIPCWGVLEDHIDQLLNYGHLSALADVSETAPLNGQALMWSSDQSKWIPSSGIAVDISNNSIDDLVDVNTSGKVTGQVLTWNGGNWEATNKIDTVFDIADVIDDEITNNYPIERSYIRNASTLNQYISDNLATHENAILQLLGDYGNEYPTKSYSGIRGIGFGVRSNAQIHKSYLYAANTLNGISTILTSGISGSTGSWIEIHPRHIRISDNGLSTNGQDGFRLASGWRIIYEDINQIWDSWGDYEVPYKAAIRDYVDQGLSNLDLNPNSIDDLGDVNTADKLNGYALVWNATTNQWVSSSGVAANLSLSSIGDLYDVDKYDNSNASTNDGWLSFNVSIFKTSRPAQTNGGINLVNANLNGKYSWTNSGGPFISNSSGAVESYVQLDNNQIKVQAANGLIYNNTPPLQDAVIPRWDQVKQQIVKGAVDYSALFFLNGNDLIEKNYNWPLEISVVTANPVYWSNFGGQYSLKFDKTNGDKIEWTTANGAPYSWNAETLWSIEFWIFIDSSTPGDGKMEYVVCPAGPATTNESVSSGIHIGLKGGARNTLFFTLGSCTSSNSTPTNTYLQGSTTLDTWTHVYAAHEGSGRYRFYINGTRVGEITNNSAVNTNGGLSIGGHTQTTGSNTNSYLTAWIDDFRITNTWVPYTINQTTVPVPVEPLTGAGWRNVFGTLNQLEDVNTITTPPVQGDVLTYDAVHGYWKPGNGGAYSLSNTSINSLADVNTDNSVPDQDDVLGWSSVNSEWRRTKIDGNGGVRPLNARSITPGVVPSAGTLYAGELFLNMADRKLYALDDTGTAFSFASGDADALYDRVVGGTF